MQEIYARKREASGYDGRIEARFHPKGEGNSEFAEDVAEATQNSKELPNINLEEGSDLEDNLEKNSDES